MDGPNKYGKLLEVDARSGQSKTLRIGAACGDAEFCLVPSGGKLVIGSVGTTYVYDPRRERRRKIGKGWIIVPSATDGRVWLGLLDHTRSNPRARPLRAVREETVDGRVVQTVHPPHGDWPAGAVTEGLLFQQVRRHHVHLRLWDLGTHRFTQRIPGAFPVDTEGDLVASCPDPCRQFDVTDTRTGTTTRVSPPSGYSFQAGDNGTLSPDGSLLAVPVARHSGRTAGDQPKRSMAIADLANGQVRVVRHSRLEFITALSWSPSGARLFFSTGRGRIMSYRPGSRRATVATNVGGRIYHLAAL